MDLTPIIPLNVRLLWYVCGIYKSDFETLNKDYTSRFHTAIIDIHYDFVDTGSHSYQPRCIFRKKAALLVTIVYSHCQCLQVQNSQRLVGNRYIDRDVKCKIGWN